MNFAVIAQQVERILGKDEVPGSNPGNSSMEKTRFRKEPCLFLSLQKNRKPFKTKAFGFFLAPQGGFEPLTYRLGGGRSILLSYVDVSRFLA